MTHHTTNLADLYEALHLPPTATPHQLKQSYRRLLLLYHPDKQSAGDEGVEDTERLIRVTEAYRVLSDPTLRAEYEARDSQAPRDAGKQRDRNPTRTISLEEFTFHPSAEQDDRGGWYTHSCRCSGEYRISVAELEEGVDVVGCEGCGEWVGVGYEVVSDEEEGDI